MPASRRTCASWSYALTTLAMLLTGTTLLWLTDWRIGSDLWLLPPILAWALSPYALLMGLTRLLRERPGATRVLLGAGVAIVLVQAWTYASALWLNRDPQSAIALVFIPALLHCIVVPTAVVLFIVQQLARRHSPL